MAKLLKRLQKSKTVSKVHKFFQIGRFSEGKERLERNDSTQHEDLGQNVDSERHEERNNKLKEHIHVPRGLDQNRTLGKVMDTYKPLQQDTIDQP